MTVTARAIVLCFGILPDASANMALGAEQHADELGFRAIARCGRAKQFGFVVVVLA